MYGIFIRKVKTNKAVPLHAMQAPRMRGVIAPIRE
jgi:hypothetical protein